MAVSAFFTAMQTYLQQRNRDDIRRVYSWISAGCRPPAGTTCCCCCLRSPAISVAALLVCRREKPTLLAVG
ncbi:MAG: hypothetical protein R2749_31130 [Acidimicrobiales bacterium]